MVFKARMAILATVTLGVLLSCPVALATFPGENGKIAFSRDGDIWIMDPDGSNQEQLTSGPAADSDPKWAPDGSAIAFGRVNDGHNRVLIYDLVGGLHRLGDLKAGFATWAPSGLRLLVVSVGSNFDPPPLAVVSLDGSIVWTIPGTGYMYDPDWAPRGDRIAVTQGDVATEILTIEPDGTNQQVVSPVPQDLDIFNEHASWSPDAGQIAFEHNPESHCTEISPGQFECKNNAQIYTVEADGNGPTELTAYDPNRTDEDPGWSPTARRLPSRATTSAVPLRESDDSTHGHGRRQRP